MRFLERERATLTKPLPGLDDGPSAARLTTPEVSKITPAPAELVATAAAHG